MDRMELSGLEVECVVGVYPRERHVPQKLRIDVCMELDLERGARREAVSASVDYAAVASQLEFLLTSCEFRMIETAAHVLSCYLLAPPALGERRAQVERVRVRLTKPGALRGVALPSVEMVRERAWASATLRHEQKPFGTVDIIHETRDAGIYRLNVAPGRGIPLHKHELMRESEMVLSEGLLCQHKPAPSGTVHRWPKRAAHCYENPTERYQTILCVDAPSFIESDEIPVHDEAPSDVPSQLWSFA
jgi:dihydroneopterin aldolase